MYVYANGTPLQIQCESLFQKIIAQASQQLCIEFLSFVLFFSFDFVVNQIYYKKKTQKLNLQSMGNATNRFQTDPTPPCMKQSCVCCYFVFQFQ